MSKSLRTAWCGQRDGFGTEAFGIWVWGTKLWWYRLAHLEKGSKSVKVGNTSRAMIPVTYVSEWLLVTASVKVADGDEVIDFGEGMFTVMKMPYCLSLNPKFSLSWQEQLLPIELMCTFCF